jgi:hypothetical protein
MSVRTPDADTERARNLFRVRRRPRRSPLVAHMGPPRCYGASSCASWSASTAAAPAGGRRAAHATEQGAQSTVQRERLSAGQRGRAQRLGRQLDDTPGCRKAAPASKKQATLASFLGRAPCPPSPGAGGPSSSAATAARRHSRTAGPAVAIVGHASTGKRAARGPAHASPQISATMLQKRIAEFPDSLLVVKASYLFCSACCVQVRCDVPQVCSQAASSHR